MPGLTWAGSFDGVAVNFLPCAHCVRRQVSHDYFEDAMAFFTTIIYIAIKVNIFMRSPCLQCCTALSMLIEASLPVIPLPQRHALRDGITRTHSILC
jgi:hypothetical protein